MHTAVRRALQIRFAPALLARQAGRLLPWAGLFALTACRPHDFPQYPPNYREYVYVTNGDSGTVSIYDVVNLRLDRELAVGVHPVAVAPSSTRMEVYVVNQGQPGAPGSISVLDAEHNAVVATIPVRRRPVAIALDPLGNFAYVANAASNNVSVVDLKARREAAVIPVGLEPAALRVAPDGNSLVVANRRGDSVSILDPVTRTVRAVFSGCPGASDVVILPDSSKAFAACSAGHQIIAIALARFPVHPAGSSHTQSPDAPQQQPDRIESLLDVGHGPVQLALKPDGGELFTMNSLSDTISEVATSTNDVGGAYLIGADPVYGVVTSDNALLYVGNLRSQWVTIYSIDDGKRAGAVHVGDGPAAMAFSADGHLLFVVDARSNDIADKAFKLP
jgi:YVTN family beta-propeller protein